MDFGFTEEQEALRKSAREVLAERSTAAVVREVMASDDGFDASLWKTISELGWLGVTIPESEGGLGLGWVEQAILLEETGRTVLPAPYLTTVGLVLPTLLLAETSELRSELLQGIADGSRRVSFAALERDGDYGAESIAAEAIADGGAYKITGTKVFVPDAQVADDLLVLARSDGGIGVFVVAASSASITALPSLDKTRRLCEVKLDGAPARLVAKDPTVLSRALDRAAVAIAAEQTGVAAQCLDMTVAYAKERSQFGRAIGSFQAVSHKLADMLLYTESARSHVYYAAWTLDEGAPDASLASASARVAGIHAARFAASEEIQLHGGIGFTWEHDLHLYYRRAKWDELFLGDETVWREKIASLLAG